MYTGNRERGASAVEFALVLPVLMMILFGIIEFGFMFYDKAVITNASREGARRGIVYRTDPATQTTLAVTPQEIRDTVSNYCASYLVSLGTGSASVLPTSTVTGNCAVPGNSLTVTVNYPYTFLLLPSIAEGLAPVINLSATTVMRCEYQDL
jgi:Flp pilus assembly protein TadG